MTPRHGIPAVRLDRLLAPSDTLRPPPVSCLLVERDSTQDPDADSSDEKETASSDVSNARRRRSARRRKGDDAEAALSRRRVEALARELADRRRRGLPRLATEFLVRQLFARLLPIARARLAELASLLPETQLAAYAMEKAMIDTLTAPGSSGGSKTYLERFLA